jgi:hypothetical protein
MNGADESKFRVGGEWIYRDADNNPYLRVRRLQNNDGGKSYPQARWAGGAWHNGKPSGPKIPYRLPQLLKAPADQPVFVVEGEKCADAVAKCGFVATTASEGAGKWSADLAQWFAGRSVYVLPDNDQPGRDHANDVAAKLFSSAREVRIVPLPGLAEGEDVADWLGRGNLPENLTVLAQEAPIWTVPNGVRAIVKIVEIKNYRTAEKSGLRFVLYKDIDPAPRKDWLVHNFLGAGELSCVFGAPGSGKSTLMNDLAGHIAAGLAWFGRGGHQRCGALRRRRTRESGQAPFCRLPPSSQSPRFRLPSSPVRSTCEARQRAPRRLSNT